MTVVGPDGTAWPAGSLRAVEHQSIRDFVSAAAAEGYLSGRVLDYGCGKQPYRDIVEAAGGEYHGFDRVGNPASVAEEDIGGFDSLFPRYHHGWDYWDAVLCTQVVQYVPKVSSLLETIRYEALRGPLVMTYPTNWPEVEPWDLHRFTKAGMERLLTEAGFSEIIRHERRAVGAVSLSGDEFAVGYGVIARA